MYRPTFPLLSVNHIDVQMTSKTVTSGHTSPMQLGSVMCEDGHPYVTDPVTGRKMCTCSLGLEVTYDPRSMMPDVRKQGMSLSGPSMGLDTSAFYPPLIRGVPVRQDRLPPYLTSGMPGQPLTFDPSLAAHPYGLLYAGMDVNGGPIRKAATRETTGPLKIWLSEHKKNPYPTKAEKIMLAIITRMTLTQVSTWFANARRRLKKENKLYPADRENRDDDDEDEDFSSSQREGNTSQSAGSEKRTTSESDTDDINVDMSDCSDIDDNVILASTVNELGQEDLNKLQQDVTDDEPGLETECGNDVHEHDDNEQGQRKIGQPCQGTVHGSTAGSPRDSPSNRPKIWSISEIINGPSSAKDNHGVKSQYLQAKTPVTLSRHACPTSSILPMQKTPSSVSFVNTLSSLASLPLSSSSSSHISPTAFRPFSSLMGVPSLMRHRPELTSFVSKYGLPISGKSSSFDRHSAAVTNDAHIDEVSLVIKSAETTTEPTSTGYNHEEAAAKTRVNKYNGVTSTKDKHATDRKNLQLPKATQPSSASSCQSINIMRSHSLSPSSQSLALSSNDAQTFSTGYKLHSERHNSVDKANRHTTENLPGQ